MQNIVTALPLLACPAGVGIMMWFMARGLRQRPDAMPEVRSTDELAADQRRLAARIEALREEPAADLAPSAAGREH